MLKLWNELYKVFMSEARHYAIKMGLFNVSGPKSTYFSPIGTRPMISRISVILENLAAAEQFISFTWNVTQRRAQEEIQ